MIEVLKRRMGGYDVLKNRMRGYDVLKKRMRGYDVLKKRMCRHSSMDVRAFMWNSIVTAHDDVNVTFSSFLLPTRQRGHAANSVPCPLSLPLPLISGGALYVCMAQQGRHSASKP